ncbi:MAG: hypothetical protein QNK24_11560 [Desulfuromusa sp.]|nr:hypothetical protein [Desulfuromusa sp.]
MNPGVPRIPYLGHGLGTHRTKSPDWLSMVLFEPGYLCKLLDLGKANAEARMDEISALLEGV